MAFKKKKAEEIEEIEEIESPKAEEIGIEREIPETESELPTVSGEQLDDDLNIVIGQIQNRITNIEATLYRLLNR